MKKNLFKGKTSLCLILACNALLCGCANEEKSKNKEKTKYIKISNDSTRLTIPIDSFKIEYEHEPYNVITRIK